MIIVASENSSYKLPKTKPIVETWSELRISWEIKKVYSIVADKNVAKTWGVKYTPRSITIEPDDTFIILPVNKESWVQVFVFPMQVDLDHNDKIRAIWNATDKPITRYQLIQGLRLGLDDRYNVRMTPDGILLTPIK
jgi:hypothetical protein